MKYEEYEKKILGSKKLHDEAITVMSGGVTTSARFFEPYLPFIVKARDSRLWDVDGNCYIDYAMGYATMILGHGHPAVVSAVKEQVEKGTFYSASHELEVKFAKKVSDIFPCAEMVRFCNSGTEATMHSIRLVRGFSRKEKIAKAEGGFHGSHDQVLVSTKPDPASAGPDNLPRPIPYTLGIPECIIKNTVVIPFNDIDGAVNVIRREQKELAGVILEPVLGSAGAIPAEKNYLMAIRETTSKLGIPLIFDEVMTGLRLSLGGAQVYYGVTPDVVCLGKALGGGFPFGAYAGKKEIMEMLIPQTQNKYFDHYKNRVYQAGSFCGHPVTLRAGLATIGHIESSGNFYNRLEALGSKLREGLFDIVDRIGIEAQITGISSIFNIHFTTEEVKDYRSSARADHKKLIDFHRALIMDGIYFVPGHFGVLSSAHSENDVELTLLRMEKALRGMN